MSIYNLYFLITKKKFFSIINIQINNILILIIKKFSKLKENKLKKIKFLTKPKKKLTIKTLLIFNNYILIQNSNYIELQQKKQEKKLKLIDLTLVTFRNKYQKQ